MSIENYKVKTCPVCPADSVVQGDHYRFEILTSSLVRMEYSETGEFEDRATQSVWFRDFPTPEFHVVEMDEELAVYTDYLEIHYNRGAFTRNGLRVVVKGLAEGNNSTWHYGEEPGDLRGTARTLDEADGCDLVDTSDFFRGASPLNEPYKGKLDMGRGILSRGGFSWFDDSRSMLLEENGWIAERRQGSVDLYFFGYGHRYLEALKDFYHLCGKTPLLPRYALGNWWSRYHRYDEEEYKALVTRFEENRVPFSVAVVDMDWHLVDDVDPKYGSGWTGYTWNRKLFPDPEEFMSWLHEHNLKISLNVHPADGVRAYEELYPQVAEAMGIDPASELPVVCDLTDPEFIETYFDRLHHPLEKEGVDFWWIDWQQGGVTKKAGLDPLWMLNHYHYQDSKWKGTRAITFSRYAGVGSHRYPIGFSGDTIISWKSLAFQPYFTATASNVGYGWWSHDIGGHMLGTRDEELSTRWYQFGVFSPINRLHSSDNPFSGKEPWKFGVRECGIMENYLRLRHELVPYLYTMNHRAHYDDEPLIWPLYYAEPDNREAYNYPNEYYFGSELLVAPITVPEDPKVKMAAVNAWIPDGTWVDFFNGCVYDGGRRLEFWRSLEEYPVLLKAGGIVPMKDLTGFDNSTDNPSAMKVRVFPAASGSFTMWEDAGNTTETSETDWASTVLTVCSEESTFTITPAAGNVSVLPAERNWTIEFAAVEKINAAVYVNGAEIEMKEEAVSYNDRTGMLTVRIPAVSIADEIRIVLRGSCAPRRNRVIDQAYGILQNAAIEFEVKRAVYYTLLGNPKRVLSELYAMHLDESVYSALVEVFSAQ